MGSIRDIAEAALTEIRELFERPALFFTGIIWPLVLVCVLASIFASGLMRSLPVAVIDLDRSSISREVVTTLQSVPSVKVEMFENKAAALEAMKAGKVYASVLIPNDWTAHLLARTGESAIELSFAKSYYAIATTLEIDIKSALSSKLVGIVAPYLSGSGGTKGSEAAFQTLTVDVFVPGNSNFNYAPFLLSTLVPCVFALSVILTMVGVFSREWREKRCRSVFGGVSSVRVKLMGKALPWLTFYCFCALGYVAWFSGFLGYAPEGSALIWALGAVLLVLSMAAFALAFVACSPLWIIAISVAIGYCAPILPFTGFSYPLDSMDAAANVLGMLLPLTWFFRIQSAEWVLGSPLSHSLYLLFVQVLFVLIPLIIGLLVFPRRVAGWMRKESEPEQEDRDEGLPKGCFATIFEGVKRGIFSPETCVIYIFAIAFYCFFYAWPYLHQTVTGIECVVVDSDRSATSRDAIERFRSLPALKIVAEEADPLKAMDLYQREAVSAVIEIPRNFEKYLLSGKPVTIAVTVNGFYTVKARAVQAAALSVTLDEAKLPLAMNLNRAGLPLSRIKALSNPPVVLVDQNLFNSIAGYANYTVPVVGPVILQAVLFMCIGMTVGGWLAKPRIDAYTHQFLKERKTFASCLLGFVLFGFIWFCYAEGLVFSAFEFSTMQNFPATLLVMSLVLVAIVALGVCLTFLLNSNAYFAQCMVVTSAPAVFLSGAIYPNTGFGPLAKATSFLFPSTPGIEAMIAVSQNGAALGSVSSSVWILLAQAIVYLVLADYLRKRALLRRGITNDAR